MKKYPVYIEYLLIVVGAFIMGFAIKNLYDPINLVTGGVSGLAIVIKSKVGVPLWLTNTLLNIPLFLASYRIKGWRFIKRTLVSTVSLSLSLYVIPEMMIMPADDILLSALFGGLISGVGSGMVFMTQATTGGTDMLAALLQKIMPHYSVPQIMQVLDAAIVLTGAAVFGIRPTLYALIAIYAVTRMSDGILEGLKFSKMVYIISDRYEEIAGTIMEEIDRGVTGLRAEGMYSGSDKMMLCCVVSRKEISQIKEIVREYDPRAFVIVSDVREVLGEGFIEY